MTAERKPNVLREWSAEKREARAEAKAAAELAAAEQAAATSKPRRRRPKAPRPVTVLADIPLLAARPGRYIAVARGLPPPDTSVRDGTPDAVVETKSKPAARSVSEVLRRYEKKVGVIFSLAPNGGLMYSMPAGGAPTELRIDLRRLAPLLRAYLAGTPLACAWDCPAEAVELLEPDDVPACAEHAGLPDAPPAVQYERALPGPLDQLHWFAAALRRPR